MRVLFFTIRAAWNKVTKIAFLKWISEFYYSLWRNVCEMIARFNRLFCLFVRSWRNRDWRHRMRQSENRTSQERDIERDTLMLHAPYVRLLLNSRRARIRPTMTTLPSFVFLSSVQGTRFIPVLHPVHRHMLPRRTIAAYYASCTLATSEWAIADSESSRRESQRGPEISLTLAPCLPWETARIAPRRRG